MKKNIIKKILNRIFAVKLESKGSVFVNGKEFDGKEFNVKGYIIEIDGEEKEIYFENLPNIKIEIKVNGDVENMETTSGNVNVSGSCGNVKSTSGDIVCYNVGGNVESTSGNIRCTGYVGGDISTVSGDIKR